MKLHSRTFRALSFALLFVAAAIVNAQGSAPPSMVSFVVGDTALNAGDQTVVNTLVGHGHTVVLHDDDGITASATAGSDAILISSTASSTQVLTKFKHDLRPVIVWEASLLDDFGMTGIQENVDYGWEFGVTEIDLIAADSPIGDGLALGPVTVTGALEDTPWGVPGSSAFVAATVLGDPGRAVIFTYDQGATLADGGPAWGKRASFFGDDTSASVWAADGLLLFEQVVEWALVSTPTAPVIIMPPLAKNVAEGATADFSVVAGGYPAPTYQWQKDGIDLPGETGAALSFTATAADAGYYSVVVSNSEGTVSSDAAQLTVVGPWTFSFVVGNVALSASDQSVYDKLIALGHSVTVHDDGGITVGATAGSDAVIISSSVNGGLVAGTFTTDTRPILLWESAIYGDMGLTGDLLDADFGTVPAQTQIELIDVGTRIANGFTLGRLAVTSSSLNMNWGVPGAEARVIATLVGDPSRATVFSYDQGATLADGGNAAGMRVALYQTNNSAAAWTAAGEQLFEQAISALFLPPLTAPTILTQPQDSTVVEGATATFTVAADGDPAPTYQWRYEGLDLPGETGATLSFQATLADAGGYDVVVTNASGSVTSVVATLTVTNVNESPAFTSTPVTDATQGVAYAYDVMAADPDTVVGDTLTFSAPDLPAWLALVDNGDGTALLSGTPGNQDIGIHSVTLQVVDSGGLGDTQDFAVTVVDVNDAPSFTSTPPLSVDQGSSYLYWITVDDPDAAETLAISAPTLPAWLVLTDNGDGTARLSGTPAQANVGDHPVVLEVGDAAGATASQSFTVTVVDVELSPTFTSRPITATTEGQLYRYGIAAADADGDPVELRAGTLPSWITFTNNGNGTGELLGTPTSAHIGIHAVELFAEDGTGATVASQTFTIAVTAAADGPVITLNGNPQMMLRQGQSFTDPGATATDPQDGDLTSSIVVSNPVNTQVLGTYTVIYSVADTVGNASQAQRTVVVQRQPTTGGGSIGLGDLIALLLLAGAASLRRASMRPGATRPAAR